MDDSDDVEIEGGPSGVDARLARKQRNEAREAARLQRVAQAAVSKRAAGAAKEARQRKQEQRRLERLAQKVAARRSSGPSTEEARLARVAEKAAARRGTRSKDDGDADDVMEDEESRLQRLAEKIQRRRSERALEAGEDDDEQEEEEEEKMQPDIAIKGQKTTKQRTKDQAGKRKQKKKGKKAAKAAKAAKSKEEGATERGEAKKKDKPPKKKQKKGSSSSGEEGEEKVKGEDGGSDSDSSSSSSDSSSSSSSCSSSASSHAQAVAKALASGLQPPARPRKLSAALADACFGWESATAGRVTAAMVHAAASAAASTLSPLASAAEVERFLGASGVDRETAQKFRMLPANYQSLVMERGPVQGVRNPSSVLCNRIHDVESGRVSAPPSVNAHGVAQMPGSNPAIEKMIKDNDLDSSASGVLRSLPASKIGLALSLKLEEVRNPSALIMQNLQEHARTPTQMVVSKAISKLR